MIVHHLSRVILAVKKNRRSQYGKRTYLLHSCHVTLLERFDLTTSNLQGYTVIIIDLLEKIKTRFHQPKLCVRGRGLKNAMIFQCLNRGLSTKPKRDLLRKMAIFHRGVRSHNPETNRRSTDLILPGLGSLNPPEG